MDFFSEKAAAAKQICEGVFQPLDVYKSDF